MTKLNLAEIEARVNAATPGPWIRLGDSTDGYNSRVWFRDDFRSSGVPDQQICLVFGEDRSRSKIANKGQVGECIIPDDEREHNLRFICAARTDIPKLLSHIDELELENERLQVKLGMMRDTEEMEP